MNRWLLVLLLSTACRPAPPGELTFVRGGVLLPTPSPGNRTGRFVAVDWQPGAHVAVDGLSDAAPARPECVPLFSVPLGDLDAQISRGISTPGTALAWGPDGRLAVGSTLGEVLVLDGWTGAVLARRRLAEAAIKRVAWSADGQVLYAAEQSPDAFVVAMDGGDLAERWRFRLADELQSSTPPADDIYGVFTLPAAYGLEVLPGGDLLVVGLHTWPQDDGRRNLSRVWRLASDGQVRAAFPPDGPADAVFRAPRVAGGRVAFPVGRSASGPPPPDLPIDGVLVLDLDDLRPRFSYVGEPLRPHFTQAGIWEAVDLGEALLVGFADGRLQRVPLDGGPVQTLELGTPIVAGDVPVAASVSWGRYVPGGGFVAATGPSNIPWGSEVAASRPPAAHPGGDTVWAYAADGALRWNWHADLAVQGLSVSPDGRRLAVGGGPRPSDQRRDRFGAAVFRLDGDGAGEQRLEAFCPTAAPVFFDHALADDGRLAVSEVPFLPDAGAAVAGAYRVTVLR